MAEDQRQYRDRLFNFIFGAEENRAWTLSLYNAVNGSDYTDPSAIQITTIREVMYLGMHNDVSFLISEEMHLYEQQSSYNPNMPLRMLQYAGNLYERYVVEHKLNKYGSALLELPVPRLVVFYNGEREAADVTELRLSDSFPRGARSDIEVCVRMLNVNYGRNGALLEACAPLREYAWLVKRIRDNKKREDLDSAIDRAVSELPESFAIRPFLLAHRSEVKGMLLTEYDEAATMELFKEDGRREGRIEGRREGRKEGRLEGIIKTLVSMVRKDRLTLKEAAEEADMTEAEFMKYMNEAQTEA